MSRGIALLFVLVCAGCGPALFSITSYRGDLALDRERLEALELLLAAARAGKAEVLDVLGPPAGILGQPDGEVFLYRRVARDANTVSLNPSYVFPPAPSVPIYVDADVSGRDDLLMVFFDQEGRLRSASLRQSIGEVSGSRAATFSEAVRAWVE